MAQGIETSQRAPDDYVEFWAAGQAVKGEFHCSECGYGVTIVRALPLCPMCGGASWEQSPWSPFTRARHPL
jgi:rubrerythrin